MRTPTTVAALIVLCSSNFSADFRSLAFVVSGDAVNDMFSYSEALDKGIDEAGKVQTESRKKEGT